MNSRGFTLIELMLSVALLTLGIITAYGVLSGVIFLSFAASQKLTATYLTKEGMEIVRNIRDNNFINNKNWDKDIKNCSNGCQADYKVGTSQEANANKLQKYDDNNLLMIGQEGFYSYDSGTPTRFKRKITTTIEDKDVMKVTVEVFWDYRGKDFEFSTEGYLYNWY